VNDFVDDMTSELEKRIKYEINLIRIINCTTNKKKTKNNLKFGVLRFLKFF